jgi:hypothetical protein
MTGDNESTATKKDNTAINLSSNVGHVLHIQAKESVQRSLQSTRATNSVQFR